MGEWPAREAEALGLDVLASLITNATDGVVVLDADWRCRYGNPAARRLLGLAAEQLEGRDFLTLLPESEQRPMLEGFAAGGQGTRGPSGSVLLPPAGSGRDVETSITSVETMGGRLLVAFLTDVSEHRRQAREAAVLAEAAAAAAVSESIEATIQALAECAQRGTRALGAAVMLDDEHECAAWIQVAGLPEGFRQGVRASTKAGGTLADCEMRDFMARRIVVSADARSQLEGDPRTAAAAEPLKELPWQASVYAPLVYQDAIVGVLIAIFRDGDLPSEAELTFLGTLADQAAVAASNARRIVATQERVALDERRRLSRELHDFVSPALYGIALGARVARELLERDPSKAVQPLEIVLRLAEEGLQETRALIFERRPDSLEMEGLVASLNRQLGTLRSRHGIAADDVRGTEPEATTEAKQVLYRIGQEALQNAARHAQARRVLVRIERQDSSVRLDIEDDGIGFDPRADFPGHLGLRSMQERAAAVGGRLEVVSPSEKGTGTRVIVTVPADAHGEAAPAGRPGAGGASKLGAGAGTGFTSRP